MAISHRMRLLAQRRAVVLILITYLAVLWQGCAGTRLHVEPIQAPFPMPELQAPSFPDHSVDIRDYGAEEGVVCTKAIRAAIVAVSRAGGGHVRVPAGRWLTGAIHLENGVDLHLEKDALLLFSQDPNDYLPVVFSRHEDTECYKHSAFVYADGKTDIAITGEGVLDGQGKPWWRLKEEGKATEARLRVMAEQGVPVEKRIFDGSEGNMLRPAFFQPMRCTNVLVEGVTFRYGAFWTITPTYCENVIVRGVTIETEGEYGHTPNGDGVNPSSSRNVLIEHCTFDTGDDCIAIKAGRDADGLRVNRPTENIVIRHCRGLQGHGGIVIGSETSGGVRNIFAYDCQFRGTDRIVRLKTTRGRGGVLERMWFQDLTGEEIQGEAIHLNMLYTGTRLPAQSVDRTTPQIRDIHFRRITCSSGKTYAIELLGLPEMPIENITFDSLSMSAAKGIACTDARGIRFRTVKVTPKKGPAVSLLDCRDITMEHVAAPVGIEPFLKLDGASSEGIRIRANGSVGSPPSISRTASVPPHAVTME